MLPMRESMLVNIFNWKHGFEHFAALKPIVYMESKITYSNWIPEFNYLFQGQGDAGINGDKEKNKPNYFQPLAQFNLSSYKQHI